MLRACKDVALCIRIVSLCIRASLSFPFTSHRGSICSCQLLDAFAAKLFDAFAAKLFDAFAAKLSVDKYIMYSCLISDSMHGLRGITL